MSAALKEKLRVILREKLEADQVSVESDGPADDKRLIVKVVSPKFRGLPKVEERDSLIWEAVKDELQGVKHLRLHAWTPEDSQLHTLHQQAPAFFADNK